MSTVRRDPKQLEAAHPGHSAWVSANAGSGKTHVLVNRIARLLLAGAEPSTILCLTYTNAAAAEMASRIYARLGSWTGLADAALSLELAGIGLDDASPAELKRARQLFALALDTPGGFKIQTIHGFCERILQLFPIEAGLAPGFQILEPKTQKQMLKQAQEHVLGFAAADPTSAVGEALATVTRYVPADDLDTLLQQVLDGAPELGAPDAAISATAVEAGLRRFFGLSPSLTLEELRQQIVDFDRTDAERAAELLLACAPAPSGNPSKNKERGEVLRDMLNAGSDADFLSVVRSEWLLTKNGSVRKPYTVSKGCEDIEFVQQVVRREENRLTPLMTQHDKLLRVLSTTALIVAAQAALNWYKATKKQMAAYDFDDLIAATRDLLTDRAASAWVRYKLDKSIEHVLVDEAQDTSPAQWQILAALTEEFFAGDSVPRRKERTLFVVGDQKQSIFSFQGADVRMFEAAQREFQSRARAALQDMPEVQLTTSFRTTPQLLAIVDKVFQTGMPARRALGTMGSEGLSHVAVRQNEPGLFELWPLIRGEKTEPADLWALPQGVRELDSPHRLLARRIATAIKGWIGQSWRVGDQRPVSPDDILILFRKRGPLFTMLIAELRAAGVPVAGADRLRPAENIGVLDMLALMRSLTMAADDHTLACVLKSPLVSQPVTEDQLIALCHGRKASLWQQLQASPDPHVQQLHAELCGYRQLAERLRPYEFIATIVAQRKSAIAARLGREAEDALAALADAALAYEEQHAASIAGFVEWFRAEEVEIKRDMEATGGEVRLMTTHGAKGLEARIVILPDTTDTRNNDRTRLIYVGEDGNLPLWNVPNLVPAPEIDDEKSTAKALQHSEYARLLYVAMTRARDALFVCGATTGDKLDPASWYAMVEAALEQDSALTQTTTLCGEPGLRFGEQQLWSDGGQAAASQSDAVVIPPYMHRAVAPPALKTRGLTATRLADPQSSVHAPQQVRLGRIIHRILETLPDLAMEKRAAYAERVLGRAGLDPAVGGRLLGLVSAPENEALFGPGSAAEVAVGARLPDGTRLTGVIDRLVIRQDDILIVDYKSDTVAGRLTARHPHVRQLASYCYCLTKIHPGKTVKAAVLWTGEARLEWVAAAEIHAALAEISGSIAVTEA